METVLRHATQQRHLHSYRISENISMKKMFSHVFTIQLNHSTKMLLPTKHFLESISSIQNNLMNLSKFSSKTCSGKILAHSKMLIQKVRVGGIFQNII